MHALVSRLCPEDRVRWLSTCCAWAGRDKPMKPCVTLETLQLAERARVDDSADRRLSFEVYLDGWRLHVQHGLDMDKALRLLVDLARRKRTP